MNNKVISKLMHILLVVSMLAVMVGVIFKVQHYPLGNSIMMTGLFANLLVSGLEINRLRKVIGELSK